MVGISEILESICMHNYCQFMCTIIGTMYTCSVECNPRSDELQYEQCCSSDNIGKFFQVVESGIPQGYIVCPDTLPDWCE